jgi:hypothetical protein
MAAAKAAELKAAKAAQAKPAAAGTPPCCAGKK